MCFYDDSDPADFCHDKIVVARCQHVCSECSRAIGRGDTYYSMRGLSEGEWWHYACCARCYFVRVALHQLERQRGCAEDESWPPLGTLSEVWEEDEPYDIALGLRSFDDDAEQMYLRNVPVF